MVSLNQNIEINCPGRGNAFVGLLVSAFFAIGFFSFSYFLATTPPNPPLKFMFACSLLPLALMSIAFAYYPVKILRNPLTIGPGYLWIGRSESRKKITSSDIQEVTWNCDHPFYSVTVIHSTGTVTLEMHAIEPETVRQFIANRIHAMAQSVQEIGWTQAEEIIFMGKQPPPIKGRWVGLLCVYALLSAAGTLGFAFYDVLNGYGLLAIIYLTGFAFWYLWRTLRYHSIKNKKRKSNE